MKLSTLILTGFAASLLFACAGQPSQPASSKDNEDAMWQKFQAQKEEKSLDKDIESYREKKSQE